MRSFLRKKQAQAFAALIIVIAVLATLVGLGLSTGIAGASSPNSHAQKVSLTTMPNRDCSFGDLGGGGTGGGTGFAIVNKTASGKLIAEVGLRNALPNTTYTIRLIQEPSTLGCNVSSELRPTFTTDDLGNGNGHIEATVNSGDTSVWVDLNNSTNPDDYYYTPLVPFSAF